MIELYTDALKKSLESKEGNRDILEDVRFLSLDFNENKVRSLFIKWN